MKKTNVEKIVISDIRKYNTLIGFETWFGNEITTIGDHQGKPIHEVASNKMIHCAGFAFSAATMNVNKTAYMVIVDDLFKNSPNYVQEFMRNHEIGHIKLSHLDNSVNNIQNKIKRLLGISTISQNEYEADAYSAARVGYDNAIKALTYLLDNYSFGFLSNREMKNRLKILKRSAV